MLVKARKQVVGVGRVRSYFDVVPGLVVFARREILEDQTVTMVQIKLGTFRAHAEIGASNVGVPRRRRGFTIQAKAEKNTNNVSFSCAGGNE